jgi:hypothetical protein
VSTFVRLKTYHKDFDIHFLRQLGMRKEQDSLHNNNLLGFHTQRRSIPTVCGEIVGGNVTGRTRLELLQVLQEQVRIERVGVVEIRLGAFLKGLVRDVLIVIVMKQVANVFGLSEFFVESSRQVCLERVTRSKQKGEPRTRISTTRFPEMSPTKPTFPAPLPPAIPTVMAEELGILAECQREKKKKK